MLRSIRNPAKDGLMERWRKRGLMMAETLASSMRTGAGGTTGKQKKAWNGGKEKSAYQSPARR